MFTSNDSKDSKDLKNENKSDNFINSLQTLITKIFNKNKDEKPDSGIGMRSGDEGSRSAMLVESIDENFRGKNLEWTINYSTKKTRPEHGYGSPSVGSYGRYEFIKNLQKLNSDEKMNMTVKDRHPIVVTQDHDKFLKCLKDSIPQIYAKFKSKWPGHESQLAAEEKEVSAEVDKLIKQFSEYLKLKLAQAPSPDKPPGGMSLS